MYKYNTNVISSITNYFISRGIETHCFIERGEEELGLDESDVLIGLYISESYLYDVSFMFTLGDYILNYSIIVNGGNNKLEIAETFEMLLKDTEKFIDIEISEHEGDYMVSGHMYCSDLDKKVLDKINEAMYFIDENMV